MGESKPNEPELEMCVFSFMLSLSSKFIVGVIFTNKLYLLLKKQKPINNEGGQEVKEGEETSK